MGSEGKKTLRIKKRGNYEKIMKKLKS